MTAAPLPAAPQPRFICECCRFAWGVTFADRDWVCADCVRRVLNRIAAEARWPSFKLPPKGRYAA